jgi:DNA polymerase III epsilon subunit-like protein
MSVHGISWEDVKEAPAIDQLANTLKHILDGRLVAIYNADFDTRLLRQSIRIAGATEAYEWFLDQDWEWERVMKVYAEFWGERNRRYGGYR